MSETRVIARKMSRGAATRKAERMRKMLKEDSGKSSGWARIDYSVRQTDDRLRRWHVVERSV